MKKTKKKITKLVAVITVLTTAFLYPIQTYAVSRNSDENTETTAAQSVTEETTESNENDNYEIVAEIKEKRDAVTKCFELSNGNKMLVQYDLPVHFKDEEGNWVEYDNSMTETVSDSGEISEAEILSEEGTETQTEASETSSESTELQKKTEASEIPEETNATAETAETPSALENDTEAVTEPSAEISVENEIPSEEAEASDNDSNAEYKNKKSDIDIRLSKKSKQNNMIMIKENDYKVSWGYSNANKSKVEFINNNETLAGNRKFTTPKNVIKEAVYKDIFTNVDLQCYVSSVGVKENLVLKDKNVQSEFQIRYKLNGLTAKQLNSNTIELTDKNGKAVYSITAPYMTDSNGEHSKGLNLSIVKQKGNNLTVKLSADKEWLNASDRQYPITIDPSFNTSQDWNASACAYIDSSKPATAFGYGSTSGYTGTIYAGTFGQGMYRSLVKMNNLPTLNKGDVIVEAYLNLHLYQNGFHKNMYVGAYHVMNTMVNGTTSGNTSWEQDTVTWNTRPNFESSAVDYEKFVANDPDAWHNWNITSSVKRWYNGEANNGIMLKSVDENSEAQCASFYSSAYPLTSVPRAVFTLVYRNNKGLEDYWTYSSFNVGTAGTAYVNDYSGNLTFVESDLSTAGSRAPASIQHVFNNYMSNQVYSKTLPYVGKGWKLNIQQTLSLSTFYGLTGDAAEKYPYVYTDADGTEHYFYKKTENGKTTYVDEDGLKLELTLADNNGIVKIKDEKDNVLEFDRNGFLTATCDSNGNRTTVAFVSTNRIKQYKDGAGKHLTLSYTTDNYLNKITDPAGRSKSYTYTNNLLTQIKNSDGTTIKFSYDSDGSISSITDIDGYKVTFSYSSKTSGKRVTAIQEYGTNGSAGQKITFNHNKYNQTDIRSSGVDGVYGNSDDTISTYQFDQYGRTISIKNKIGGKETNASVYKYTDGELSSNAANFKQLNRVSTAYTASANSVNLLKNHNMESSSSWTASALDGSNTFTNTYTTADKYFGQKSLKLSSTAYSGDSKAAVYQNINLTAGKTYTLTAYVKTQNITSSATDYGAAVCATIGSNKYYSEFIKSTTDTAVNNGWRRVTSTFTVPLGSSSARISLEIRAATGTAYFDGIQLEEYTLANNYNMLENSGFESYTNSMPANWSYTGLSTGTDCTDTSVKSEGNASFKITGNVAQSKEIYQTIPVSGSENDTYIVGGWAKANSVPDEKNEKRTFSINAKVNYSDGTSVTKDSAEFNRAVSDWQYSSFTFNLSDNTSAVKTPVSVTIYLKFNNQPNTVYFDNIQLIKDATQSYTYNSDGELVTVVSNAEQQSKMEYSNSDLTKNIDAKGYAYTYSYDSKHNMTSATSQRGTSYNYTYDSNGNATALEIKNPARSMVIKSTAEYTTNGAFVSKVTDQNGYEVTYDYDQNNGTLKSASDSSGAVNYTYNSLNNLLTGVSKFVENDSLNMTTTYSYTPNTSRNLTQISHNGSNYNIEYDSFNNKTATKVGSQLLASYTYGANNGLLKSMSYGNGKTVSYTYDNYGNTSSVSYNGTTAFKWYSDKTGAVTRENDFVNNLQTNFDYDTTGRLVRQSTIDISKSPSADRTGNTIEYSYDLNNNITKLVNITPDGTKKMNYSYGKDNLLEKFTLSSSRAVNYAYDGLGRTTSTTITTNTPIEMSYLYNTSKRNASGSDLYRTTQVYKETIGDEQYKYTYDTLGNITKIELSNDGSTFNKLYEYEYDEASQLIAENDYANNKRSMYYYDEGGNMTDESVFYFASGISGLPITTENISYDYTDSNWTDKLTKYNDDTITYDEIGNPLNYRDGIAMTWQNGRQLASLQQNGNNISYKYDSNGVRTSKTVNGEKWTYQYLNGNLLYETRGEKFFHYYYDANGMLYAVSYKLTPTGNEYVYYYSHNWRGDIIGLYNGNGELRAKYTYDAWGNVTSITDQNGNAITSQTHVGNLNPFRYRGYYQDTETGFYYLMSRYYDTVTHRFVNADGYFQTGSNILDVNMNIYCRNNPVNCFDLDGKCPVGFIGPCPGINKCKYFQSFGLLIYSPIFLFINKKLPPPPETGYQAPKSKKPSGRKNQKVKSGNGNGFLDKQGRIWIPDDNMHGGEGWTRQYPNGSHDHVYPDGKVRGKVDITKQPEFDFEDVFSNFDFDLPYFPPTGQKVWYEYIWDEITHMFDSKE